jgi:serine/threonine protein phosphatase PrpC
MPLHKYEQASEIASPEVVIAECATLIEAVTDKTTAEKIKLHTTEKIDTIQTSIDEIKQIKATGAFDSLHITPEEWAVWEDWQQMVATINSYKVISFGLQNLADTLNKEYHNTVLDDYEKAVPIREKAMQLETKNYEIYKECEEYSKSLPQEVVASGKKTNTLIMETVENIRAKSVAEAEKKGETYGYLVESASFGEPVELQFKGKTIFLAVDKGLPKPGYETQPNEDRIVVINAADEIVLADIDGMGGYGHGDVAAEIFGNTIRDGVEIKASTNKIVLEASRQLLQNGLENAGVCFAVGRIKGDELAVSYAGDTRCVVVRGNKVVFATKDQGFLSTVSNATTGLLVAETEETTIHLEPNDKVLFISDGITDQFTPSPYQEMAWVEGSGFDLEQEEKASNEALAKILAEHEDPKIVISKIDEHTMAMMHGQGKKDHRSIIIYCH